MDELIRTVQTVLPDNLTDWIVYAAIALVSLIGVIKCLITLWTTTAAMHRAIRRLQDHAGEKTDRPVWQEPRFMGKRLKGSWLRFLQNAQQLDRRGLPCNVEDYINDDTVTHGPGNAQLAELIPSLLTSLGILGTFIGMTQGLAGLRTSSTEEMMNGIQTLIAGMRFAFGTSVAGVSCSLIFNMLNRIAQGSSYRAIDDFVENFTQLAMQRPLDNDVQLICQNQDRNALLGEVTETVSGRITASIELAVGRALSPVAASMDRFLIGATKGQIDGVQRITDAFVERMNASLNSQFLELGRTLTEVSRHEQVTLDRLQQTTAAAQSIMNDVNQLHAVSNGILDHFQSYVSELTIARNRDEGFEQTASSLLASMQAAARDQSELLRALRNEQAQMQKAVERFSQENERALRNVQDDAKNGREETAQITAGMREAGRNLADSCTAMAGQIGEIARSVGAFDEGMKQLNRLLSERTDALPAAGTDGTAAEILSRLQTTLADMERVLERAVGGKREEA